MLQCGTGFGRSAIRCKGLRRHTTPIIFRYALLCAEVPHKYNTRPTAGCYGNFCTSICRLCNSSAGFLVAGALIKIGQATDSCYADAHALKKPCFVLAGETEHVRKRSNQSRDSGIDFAVRFEADLLPNSARTIGKKNQGAEKVSAEKGSD